jgi:hypothetical protein
MVSLAPHVFIPPFASSALSLPERPTAALVSNELPKGASAKAEFVQNMARQVAENMAQTLGTESGVRVKIKVELPVEGKLPTDSGHQMSLESQAYSKNGDATTGKPVKTSISWHSASPAPAKEVAKDTTDFDAGDKQFQQQLQQFTQQLDQSLQQLLNTMPQNELQSPWLNSYAPSPITMNGLLPQSVGKPNVSPPVFQSFLA